MTWAARPHAPGSAARSQLLRCRSCRLQSLSSRCLIYFHYPVGANADARGWRQTGSRNGNNAGSPEVDELFRQTEMSNLHVFARASNKLYKANASHQLSHAHRRKSARLAVMEGDEGTLHIALSPHTPIHLRMRAQIRGWLPQMGNSHHSPLSLFLHLAQLPGDANVLFCD